jgi:glutathione S-transferase
MPAVREQLGILDRAVARTGYLVSDQFTFADINLLPIVYRVRQLPEGAKALATASHLAAYYDTHAARPSFARTAPPGGGPPGRTSPKFCGGRETVLRSTSPSSNGSSITVTSGPE